MERYKSAYYYFGHPCAEKIVLSKLIGMSGERIKNHLDAE